MLGLVPKTEFLKWPRDARHYKRNKLFRQNNSILSQEQALVDPLSFHRNPATLNNGRKPIRTHYAVRHRSVWWLGYPFRYFQNEDNKRAKLTWVSAWATLGDRRSSSSWSTLKTIIHCLLVRGPRLTHCNKMNRLPLLGEYYWLTCTIDEGNYNMLVNGVQTKQYSDAKFRCDYISKNGGIKVKFDGTSESVHFNWRTTKENPSSIMFFGAPLS